jgi:anti-sigma factor RsiW
MIPRRCWAIRRDLSAFQDGELPVKARVAVQEHLRECPACAVEARELRELGDALRAARVTGG